MVSPMAWTFEDRLRAAAARGRARRLEGPPRRVRRPGARVPDARARRRRWSRAGTRSRSRPGSAGASTPRRPGWRSRPRPSTRSSRRRERPLKPYEAAVRAARETRPSGARVRARRRGVGHPHARAGAGRRAGGRAGGDARPARPSRTCAPGFPPYSIGARLPRTRLGRALWRADRPAAWRSGSSRGATRVQRVPRAARARRRCRDVHTGLSRSLTMVGDAAAARVPARVAGVAAGRRAADVGAAGRARSSRRRATGRSCSSRRRPRRTREHRLLRAALEGLADEPVRVIATWNGREPDPPIAVPANAVLVPWLSYAQTMPRVRPRGLPRRPRDAGARARQRLPGRRLPGRRATWPRTPRASTGPALGVRLPRRFCTPRGVRAGGPARAARAGAARSGPASVARWVAAHDGGARAAASWKHGRDERAHAARPA